MSENKAFSPEHYTSTDGFETVDFVERVLCRLEGRMQDGQITPENMWQIGSALKYTMRAGKKGNWETDADKCANFLCRALTGRWLDQ